jgi:hypothetical protein
MIKRYSDWERINEVDELTEPTLAGKYINGIIQTYEKYPSVRPSRNVQDFANAKETQPLSTFMKGVSGKRSSQILESVIDQWYKWPDESEAKKVLLAYINNDDDLSNLASFGLPFGKVLQSDPTIALGLGSLGKTAIKAAAKGATKAGRSLFGWVPKLFGIKESNTRINEGAVAGFLAALAAGALLSASTRYALYGKESIKDDMFFSWTTPYLPDVKGIIGDDPIIATYVSVFNTMMMLIYDSWNLCMGQDKYGSSPNPILNWQSSGNYIATYYKEFYESDQDIKSNFISFINNLKAACLKDMKRPSVFQNSPFYYSGDKVRVNFDDGRSESIKISDWYKWVRENYKKYILVPITTTEFTASNREGDFSPLSPLGINEPAKGDPMREVTLQFPNGTVAKLSILQLELYLKNSEKVKQYEVESEDLTKGGSSIILRNREGEERPDAQDQMDIETKNPSVVKGSTFDQISLNIQKEDLQSFIGMGDV